MQINSNLGPVTQFSVLMMISEKHKSPQKLDQNLHSHINKHQSNYVLISQKNLGTIGTDHSSHDNTYIWF